MWRGRCLSVRERVKAVNQTQWVRGALTPVWGTALETALNIRFELVRTHWTLPERPNPNPLHSTDNRTDRGATSGVVSRSGSEFSFSCKPRPRH